jgi:hypothetical protein
MRTLLAQMAMSVAVLLFAALAVLVARSLSGDARRYAYAWAFTGQAFLLEGFNSLGHDLFSMAGFLGGPDSAAWNAVLRWHPVLNHSRTFLLTTYGVVLAVVLHRAARGVKPPAALRALAIVAGGMLLGALAGWFEPFFTNRTHYSAVAIFDIMEMLTMMGLLVIGITSGGMDRALWLSLGINTFVVSLSVLLFAASAELGVVGQWAPRPLHVQTAKAAMHAVMVVVAWIHLQNVRRGRTVRGLIDIAPPPSGIPSLHG